MSTDRCRSNSDDLGCYEHSGGFYCDLRVGHPGPHIADVLGSPSVDLPPMYRVTWYPINRNPDGSVKKLSDLPPT